MNTIINKSKLNMAASALAIAAMVFSLVPMQAFAQGNPNVDDLNPNVTICHANNGANFYNNQTVDAKSIVNIPNGHKDHDTNGLDNKGDIIPEFDYNFDGGVVEHFGGQNLNTAYALGLTGQQILNAACVVPTTGTITVNKLFSGITDIAANLFGFSINNGASVAFEADASNSQTVNLGAYTVVESGVTNNQITVGQNTYTVSYTGCSGTISATPSICTIKNTYVQPNPTLCTDPAANNNSQTLPCTYTDVCPNITGNQATVPTGKEIVNGQCVDIVVIPTLCTDPAANNNGQTLPCTYTDACPNIGGNQATVPDGQVIVNNQCVPIVNGCTNPLATNYNQSATPANPQAAACTLNYVSQCGQNPNLLTNGDFETPTPTANSFGAGFWEIFPGITGWTATNGIEVWDNMLNAVGGNQVVELDSTGSSAISQTYATILGATYELRFDFAARTNAATLADNSIVASVDGNPPITTSTTNTNWTTFGTTFTADASTDITLADVGTSNGLGTVIDNAVLCLVREPAPVDFCPNIDGNQVLNSHSKDVNGQCYTPITSCSVNVVSDTTNTENGDAALVVIDQPLYAWVPSIVGSVAQWIWGSPANAVIDGANDESQTFVKTFVWSGSASTAILELAADNTYSVKLNGTVVGGESVILDNFTSTDTIINLTDDVIQGVNTLEITVTNKFNGATSLNSTNGNPAGLLYDLTITNTTGDCAPGGGGDNDPLSCEITVDDASIRRGDDVTLSWTSVGASVASLLGDDVETADSLLVENVGSDTTYTLTVYGKGEGEDRESVTCSVSVDTRSGGGGGGGTRVDNDPDGEVLGDSDSPKPLVLGDQTSVVPTGAPNTGNGGTATIIMGQFLALPRRRNHA